MKVLSKIPGFEFDYEDKMTFLLPKLSLHFTCTCSVGLMYQSSTLRRQCKGLLGEAEDGTLTQQSFYKLAPLFMIIVVGKYSVITRQFFFQDYSFGLTLNNSWLHQC